MRRSTRARALALVALLALFGLGGALCESFVHTDDGCVVEVHCIACRLALGGAAVFPTAPVLAAFLVAVPVSIAPEPLARPTTVPRLLPARAPPLA